MLEGILLPSNMATKTEGVICRLRVAGQNLKYARTVNAKVILRKGCKDDVALLMKESFLKLFSNFLTEELSLCLQMPFHLICR